MVTTEFARTTVGIIGNVISFILFLSPVQKFIDIWKTGEVGNFSEIPCLSTFVNCAVWIFYALPMVTKNSMPILVIDSVGLGIESIYMYVIIRHSHRNKGIRLGLIVGVATLLVLGVGIPLILSDTKPVVRSRVFGIIGAITNIIMYGSPLSSMCTVISTGNVESMSLPLSLCSLLSGVVWFVYAMLPLDPFIAIPSIVGVVLAILQLALYWYYYV